MYVDVDMRHCGFFSTPTVFSTERGVSSHWTATGANSHYSLTRDSFRVYVTSPYAWRYRFSYQISWIAFGKKRPNAVKRDVANRKQMSTCCGEVPASKWNRYNAQGHLWQDIDMRRCHFTATPQVMTSLSGISSHWTLLGTAATYSNSPSGFRSYIYGTTPEIARQYKYRLSWCATGPTAATYHHGIHLFDRFNNPRSHAARVCCGKVTPTWTNYPGIGVYADINTSHCKFSPRVKYFGSLQGNSGNWMTTGGDAIYSHSATGFRTYIYSHGWLLRTQYAVAYGYNYDWCGVDA